MKLLSATRMSATPSLLSKPKRIHYRLNPERPNKVYLAGTTNDLNDLAGLIPALKFLERFPRLDQTGCSAFTRQQCELSTGLCDTVDLGGRDRRRQSDDQSTRRMVVWGFDQDARAGFNCRWKPLSAACLMYRFQSTGIGADDAFNFLFN